MLHFAVSKNNDQNASVTPMQTKIRSRHNFGQYVLRVQSFVASTLQIDNKIIGSQQRGFMNPLSMHLLYIQAHDEFILYIQAHDENLLDIVQVQDNFLLYIHAMSMVCCAE